MVSLLLAIWLLGAGVLPGVTGTVSTTDLPASTKQPVDDILQINERLVSEEQLESDTYFEGDIVFPKTPTAFSPNVKKWAKKNGIVIIPYVLHPSYLPAHLAIINAAFHDFHATTCIRFVQRTDQRAYIFIRPGLGCYSSIGCQGAMQTLSLSFDCFVNGKGSTLHELLHVLGFWHEHSRADRDLYVRINWDAIKEGYEQNFCKFDTTNMIVNYTLGSILHYSEYAFGEKEGLKTIVPLTKGKIGQREKLHEMDILRVNKLYCTEPEEFLVQASPPKIYDCSQGIPKQNTDIELNSTPATFSNFRQNASLILTTNVYATQETTCSPASNCYVTQKPEFSPHTSSFTNREFDLGPASKFSATQELEFIPALNFSTSEEPEFSPSVNYSATQEREVSPWLEANSTIKNSVMAILEVLGSSASQMSPVTATKKIVLAQKEFKENRSLKNTMSSFLSPRTAIPEQNNTDNIWYPRNKAEISLSEDEEDGHLKMAHLNIRGKRSLPASREPTIFFQRERKKRRHKSVLKALYEILYSDRPLSGTIKHESLCGFEAGMCRWKQSTDDDLDWRLTWGSVNVYNGHSKAGLHLSLKSCQGKLISAQRAMLVRTITWPFSCMSLWYGYLHSIKGALNIYIISDTGEKTLLWSVGGQKRLKWTKAQIDVQLLPPYYNVQVVVEGVVDPMKASKIVIDNLYVGNCD